MISYIELIKLQRQINESKNLDINDKRQLVNYLDWLISRKEQLLNISFRKIARKL